MFIHDQNTTVKMASSSSDVISIFDEAVANATDLLKDWSRPSPQSIMIVARELIGDRMNTLQIKKWIKEAEMDNSELYQLLFKKIRRTIQTEMIKEERLAKISDKYRCKDSKCGSWRTNSVEEQLRGGDEAKSVFIICTECNQQFQIA